MFMHAIHEASFRQMIEKVFRFSHPPHPILLTHRSPLISTQMNDNQIDNWSDLDELKNAKSLETVYLERNPLQKDPQYRRKIMLALPSVRQIDATFIRFWGANVQFSCWLQCSLLPPCLPYLRKEKKKHTSFWTHTCLTKLYSHSVHKHVFRLWTRPQLIWHTCALTHAMVLFIRLENCTQTPTYSLSVLCYLLLFCFLLFCMQLTEKKMQWCQHYFSCTAITWGEKASNVSKDLHVTKLAHHLSLYIQEWRVFTIHSFKKDNDVNFKGKFHCSTESAYYHLSVLPMFSSRLIATCFRTMEATVDSHRNMPGRLTIQVRSEVVLHKLALSNGLMLTWIKVLLVILLMITK